jgi:hypothetical protein
MKVAAAATSAADPPSRNGLYRWTGSKASGAAGATIRAAFHPDQASHRRLRGV